MIIIISDQGFFLLEILYVNLNVNSYRSYSNLLCLLSPIISFSLFQSNVLCPFLQFMNAFINLESADTCLPYLKKFQSDFATFKEKNRADGDVLLEEIHFIEKFTKECLCLLLMKYESNNDILKLVSCLAKGNYGESFKETGMFFVNASMIF